MNKQTEALKMAMLFAEKNSTTRISNSHGDYDLIGQQVFEACKEALKQQEQEPLYFGLTHDHTWLSISKTAYDVLEPEGRMALYTHPAKQLSDDEILDIDEEMIGEMLTTKEWILKFARAIEAKIRGE